MGFFALLMTGRPMQAQNPGSKQGVGLARPAVVAEQGRVSSSRLADHYSVVPQSQAVKGMYLGPVRRRLDADDDFFEAGNVQRALLCKLSVFRQEEEEEDGTAMMAAFEDDQPRHECMFQGCGAYFSSLKRVSVSRVQVALFYMLPCCCTRETRHPLVLCTLCTPYGIYVHKSTVTLTDTYTPILVKSTLT